MAFKNQKIQQWWPNSFVNPLNWVLNLNCGTKPPLQFPAEPKHNGPAPSPIKKSSCLLQWCSMGGTYPSETQRTMWLLNFCLQVVKPLHGSSRCCTNPGAIPDISCIPDVGACTSSGVPGSLWWWDSDGLKLPPNTSGDNLLCSESILQLHRPPKQGMETTDIFRGRPRHQMNQFRTSQWFKYDYNFLVHAPE